jgi:NAD(P)-dependent dehydrogenase (short-subunit alcohol dehydrogenase family)
LLGAVEEIDEAAARAVMDTNFFGALWVTQAALPLLRAQKSGHIVNITSIAGVAASPAGGLYAASKFALEGLTMSLALETKPLGIHVTLVEPGMFRTEFLSDKSIRANAPKHADYAETAGAAVARLAAAAGKQPGSPEKAAAAIVKLVAAEKPPLHLLLGSDALRRTLETHAAFAADIAAWESTTTGTDY